MSLLFDGVDDKLITPSLSFDTIVFDVKLIEFDLFSAPNQGGIYKDSAEGWLRLNVDWLHWEVSINGTSYSNAQYYPLTNNRTMLYFRKPNSATITAPVTLFQDGEQYYGEGELFSARFLLGGNTVAFYDMSTGTVLDQSGNGKHATLTGGTWTVTPGGPTELEPEPVRHTLSFSENVSISELFTKRALMSKRLNDSIATSDTIFKRLSVVVADTIATSEADNENVSKTIADNITFDESLSERIERNLSDFIPISDNISLSNSNTRSINLSDSIAILDSISKSLTRSIADNVDLSDKEDETVLKTLADNIALTDSLSTFGGKTILLTDSINVTDSISTTKQLSKFLAESVSISDSFSKQSAQSVKLYDVIIADDSISVFNPDAPELIGKIYLKGKRDLVVQLNGKRDLVVQLNGKLDITVRLKGGLQMYENQNFKRTQGDTIPIEFDCNEDLTGSTFKWGMKKRGEDQLVLLKEGVVTGNIVRVLLEPTDTEKLLGIFEHECETIDQHGNVTTIAKGLATITEGFVK